MNNQVISDADKAISASHIKKTIEPGNHIAYRPDIDGLRAVAVLSVVIFHAMPAMMRGGFIGVDVFFVISGFLISKIIFGDLRNDRFSLLAFYSRRARRIFPALIAVLTACAAIAWYMMLPGEFKKLGKHIAGGATFTSNILLMRESGYFDTDSATKPLLHLWSLGVEEQFYLFWPALLYLAWKRRLGLLLTTAIVATASFLFNLAISSTAPAVDFYSPASRLWELMMGGFLAWISIHRPRFFSKSESWLGPIGILLILTSAFAFKSTDNYPTWRAIVPTCGAFLVIAAGPKAWFNRNFLGSSAVVSIGLISYPLYLWHWPVLTFARIACGDQLPTTVTLCLVALSALLSVATFHLLEKPIRSATNRTRIALVSAGALAVVCAAGVFIYASDGLPHRMKDREAFTQYFDNTPPDLAYAVHNNLLHWFRSDCDFFRFDEWLSGHMVKTPKASIEKSCYLADPSKEHNVMIWGDSHAQHLYYGLANELPKNWGILVGASSGCRLRVVEADSTSDYCDRSNWFALQTAFREKPDVVIFAQQFEYHFDRMKRIKQILTNAGVKRVIFLGPVPEWDAALPTIIVRDWWLHTPRRTFKHLKESTLADDRNLRAEFKSDPMGEFVDLIDFFCNGEGCMTYLGEDRMTGIITFDYGHLSLAASDYLAKSLLVPEILRK